MSDYEEQSIKTVNANRGHQQRKTKRAQHNHPIQKKSQSDDSPPEGGGGGGTWLCIVEPYLQAMEGGGGAPVRSLGHSWATDLKAHRKLAGSTGGGGGRCT